MRLDLFMPEPEELTAECAVGVETAVAAICSSRRDITRCCAVELTAAQELVSRLFIGATPVLAVTSRVLRILCGRAVRCGLCLVGAAGVDSTRQKHYSAHPVDHIRKMRIKIERASVNLSASFLAYSCSRPCVPDDGCRRVKL